MVGEGTGCPTGIGSSAVVPIRRLYLGSAAPHDVLRDGIDLVLHLHPLEAIVCHPYSKHTEVGSSKVQSQELSMFCRQRRGHCQYGERQEQTASGRPDKTSTLKSSVSISHSWVRAVNWFTFSRHIGLFLSLRQSHRVIQACLQSPKIMSMPRHTQFHAWLPSFLPFPRQGFSV